ncbi:MAG: RNA-guided endonuclease TnpB family protein [Methylohalobius sp.]
MRASLQSKGTRGTKKVLRKLSGYERRRMAHRNHEIAKAVVAEAVRNGCSLIRMEELRGIRGRLKVPNRHLNRMISLWAFAQLQAFVRYKAAGKGIRFETVNPAYTSQTCGSCGSCGRRDQETFFCTTCGVSLDADVNAARNIAGGGVVNRPESSAMSVCGHG